MVKCTMLNAKMAKCTPNNYKHTENRYNCSKYLNTEQMAKGQQMAEHTANS